MMPMSIMESPMTSRVNVTPKFRKLLDRNTHSSLGVSPHTVGVPALTAWFMSGIGILQSSGFVTSPFISPSISFSSSSVMVCFRDGGFQVSSFMFQVSSFRYLEPVMELFFKLFIKAAIALLSSRHTLYNLFASV